MRRGSCRCPFLDHSALRRKVGRADDPSASVRKVRSTKGGRVERLGRLSWQRGGQPVGKANVVWTDLELGTPVLG